MPFDVILDILSLPNILIKMGRLSEGKRILEGITNCLIAKIEDVEERGKKRKRDDDDELPPWLTKGRELVQEARNFLGHVSESCPEKKRKGEEENIFSSQTCAKLVVVHKLIQTLSAHEKEAGDTLLRCTLSDRRGPDRGFLIPVRELVGLTASQALQQLQAVLQSNKIGRVAIHGMGGMGKTALMKHLHNCAIKWVERFEYVLWVSCPRQFSIERLQDAVAAAVKCKLQSGDDLISRAEKLFDKLSDLGTFVIFLDGVPQVNFSLDQIGIPVAVEGSKSKLVLTTRSTAVAAMLGCSETVKLDCLSDEEACKFLMDEARISMKSASLLKGIPRKLALKCHGVPRMIIDIATRMCGIDDPHEWRNELFELECSEKRAKLTSQATI